MVFFLFGGEIKREVCLEYGLQYGVGSGVMEGVGSVGESEADIQFGMVWNGGKKFFFFFVPVHIISFCFLK